MLKRKPIIDEDELRKLTEEMSMGVPEKEEEADEYTAGMTSTEEKHLWKEERESLRNKLIEEQVKGSAQDRDQRKEFAVKIFHLLLHGRCVCYCISRWCRMQSVSFKRFGVVDASWYNYCQRDWSF